MNARVVAAVALALVLGGVSPAFAFAGERGGEWGQAQQRPQPPQREQQYPLPQRRFDGEREVPPQRLTPDERRQLRRDLHDANRDIYPQRRDGRR